MSGRGTFPCFMSSSGLCSSRTDRTTLSYPTDCPKTLTSSSLLGKAFCPLPCAKTLPKLNLMQNHQCFCNGQVVMLWLHFGRLQRQRGTSTSGCSSGFNSVWEGNTLNSSLTNTERDGVRHTCTAQMWLLQGDWKLVSKSNLNRKVKSVQREREAGECCQIWLAFSKQLGHEFSVCISSLLSLLALWSTVSEAKVIEFSLNPSYVQRLFLL